MKEIDLKIEMRGTLLNRSVIEVIIKEITSFKPQSKFTIFDDHYPFHKMGITATVLIDFDYAYCHTHEDTLDKCSPESMFSVFSVVTETIHSL